MTYKLKRYLLIMFTSLLMVSLICLGSFVSNSVKADGSVQYGALSTTVQTDTTLQKIHGLSSTDRPDGWGSTEFEVKTSGMPNENDGSTVTNGYAVYIHPFYPRVTNNAIVFDTPISAEEMLVSGGLTIRMYAKLSSGNTYLVKGMPTDFSYGIYFYGLGATGDFSDHPVWIPADIKQNEYVDFKINAYNASRLADSTGYVKGLVLASNINKNEFANATDKEFYTSNPDPYIYIKSISYNAPDTTEAVAGEIKTYSGMGGLTHVNGYVNDGNPTAGYSKYWDGYSPVDIVPGPRSYEPITELPLDNGEDVEKAYRFTYHFSSGAVCARNSVLFEKPLTVADIEKSNGMTLRIYAHLTSDGSDYSRFNDTYGLFFYGYGKGITGESDDVGVVVPANVAKDEWTDLYIPAEVLKTMVGDNGVLYGLNYGARIDACSEAMYKGNPATNPGYLLLSKVTLEEKDTSIIETELKDDNTLKQIFGADPSKINELETQGYSNIEWITSGIPLENNNSAVLGAYRVYIHPFYAQVQTNAIAFRTPISAEEITEGLTIRMYVDVSASDLFYVQSRVSDYGYGIYIYGLGSTGGFDDHPVWVPADVIQREWIDFKINAYDAQRLADGSGMVRGFTFASRIQNNELGLNADNFYTADPSPYIYIKSVSLTKAESNAVKTGELKTQTGMSNLTHVQGKVKNSDIGETQYGEEYHGYNGSLLPIDIVPGPRLHHALTSLPDDNGVAVEKAYRLSLHSGNTAVAKHSILFDTPLKMDDIRNSGGLSLRVLTHLTEGGGPYAVNGQGFGIFLYGYGKGITGSTADSAIFIPDGIIQNEWTEFYISPEQVESLAGRDGVLYGLQYALHVEVGQAHQLYLGSAYSNPGYILISSISLLEKGYYSEKTITYNVYDGVEKKVTFTTNKLLSSYNVTPERQGYLFAGWYIGNQLFNFNSTATDDFTLTAKWVEVDTDISKYAGVYTKGSDRIVVFNDGEIDVSSVIEYYDDIGISKEGVLYAVTAKEVLTFDLNSMTKSTIKTVSYYSFGKLVKKVGVGQNETVEQFELEAEGFTFNGWKVGSISGANFVFGNTLTEDISLYASFTPKQISADGYTTYYGTYYNPNSKNKVVLSENNVAKLTVNGVETQRTYYVLDDGVFAFDNSGDYEIGYISPASLEIGSEIFVKLTSYFVTFDCGDGEPIIVEVNGGDYKVAMPETPVRNDCVFVRWETIDGVEYDFNGIVYKSITLYGVWQLEDREQNTEPEVEDGGCSSSIAPVGISVGATLVVAGIVLFIVRRKKNA